MAGAGFPYHTAQEDFPITFGTRRRVHIVVEMNRSFGLKNESNVVLLRAI